MQLEISNMVLEDALLIEQNFSENFDKFWSINILKNDLQNENSYYIVAKLENEVVGFAGIKIILDEASIMNIAVKVSKRNLGIGSSLLEQLYNIAKEHSCKKITLEVNENNSVAIRLYEKHNFLRIGFRKKYYNNTDNAILMEKEIN